MFYRELLSFFPHLTKTPAFRYSETFPQLLVECAGYLQHLQAPLHLQGCLGNLVGPKIQGRIKGDGVFTSCIKKSVNVFRVVEVISSKSILRIIL